MDTHYAVRGKASFINKHVAETNAVPRIKILHEDYNKGTRAQLSPNKGCSLCLTQNNVYLVLHKTEA